MDRYGLVFREVLFPAWERGVRRRPILELAERLARSQWWSDGELRSFQGSELRKLLEHAFQHSPYYRKVMLAADVRPQDVSGVDALPLLPLLDRPTAASSFLERFSDAPPRVEIQKMTSGSSGRPLEIAYDRTSEHWRQATRLRGYAWAGYLPGDKSLHFWGSLAALFGQRPLSRVKSALDHALKREHFIDCTDRSPRALEAVARAVESLGPTVIVCYAQAGAALARHWLASGRSRRDTTVICGAERLFSADRAAIVQAFGSAVFETYGSREVMLMAAECEAHDGLHVSMENLIVELVVRGEGRQRPARPGEVGEVVVTDLHNFGAPFIRYLTGDLAVRMPPGRCGCGRGLERLSSIEGRKTETLHDGAGRPVSGLFFNVLFSVMADRVRQFQVVQRADRTIDLFVVPGLMPAASAQVRAACERFLPGIPLRIHQCSSLSPGPGGKLSVVRVEGA
ncbi:MAG: phenylacetate--CoA ligase family protein [Myxococcales bacterium]|nr:phenylacetate--CoA ligase family protein [Myxococcales bacterium]MCB9583134.1 phenylacetate--CoA ligase family protein [Polyangiaceae bacterium]